MYSSIFSPSFLLLLQLAKLHAHIGAHILRDQRFVVENDAFLDQPERERGHPGVQQPSTALPMPLSACGLCGGPSNSGMPGFLPKITVTLPQKNRTHDVRMQSPALSVCNVFFT